MVDERVMDQLKSLGYLSSGGRSYELTGSGKDPKDAIAILRLIDQAESAETNLPEARRIDLLRQALAKDPIIHRCTTNWAAAWRRTPGTMKQCSCTRWLWRRGLRARAFIPALPICWFVAARRIAQSPNMRRQPR